jgi:preprotein translocase subunit SecE
LAKKDKDIIKTEKTEKTKTANQEPGSGSNIAVFAAETKEELGKVVWPSRQQLVSESAAVILMVILVSTIIYLIDNFFAWVAGKVF